MGDTIFSPMVTDAIGEIMNISLGSSATAVSNMLDHRVDITTPTVKVVNAEEFVLGDIEPAVGVEIKYVCGLEGSNIMMLKRSDVKAIVDILLGTETPDEEFELNDLSISAVCELMNQMMGSASTALLGREVELTVRVEILHRQEGSVCHRLFGELCQALLLAQGRPQVQERLTGQIADFLYDNLRPQGAAVFIEAEHLCMTMRGARAAGALTRTSALRGCMRSDARTRAEVMALLGGR